MAEPKSIRFGDDVSGIEVSYVKRRKSIGVFGWYEQYVGIQGDAMPLEEFCKRLGIQRKDLPE